MGVVNTLPSPLLLSPYMHSIKWNNNEGAREVGSSQEAQALFLFKYTFFVLFGCGDVTELQFVCVLESTRRWRRVVCKN